MLLIVGYKVNSSSEQRKIERVIESLGCFKKIDAGHYFVNTTRDQIDVEGIIRESIVVHGDDEYFYAVPSYEGVIYGVFPPETSDWVNENFLGAR